MVVPVTCFDPQIFWQFSQKWSNQCIHDFIKHIKIPGPFCRASILSRPQRQLPFSQCHSVGFLPSSRLLSSFSEVDPFFSCNFCSMNSFYLFANNVLAILLKMETFSGSSMFQSQKRSQSKNEDQEKNAILTQIFQGTIGIEVWIRLTNPRRSRRIQKEQIQSQFFATALFNTIINTGSIFRPTPVYKMVDSRQQA